MTPRERDVLEGEPMEPAFGTCAHCGQAFDPENSDAKRFATYCGRDCERELEPTLFDDVRR
jgi:RNA polymerase-binding transcription factor DksA